MKHDARAGAGEVNETELREQVDTLPWFHSIDFGSGIVSPGSIPLPVLKAQADIYFPDGMQGKTVLDIGCWDGFNSIEAARRGAARVLATDHFAWTPRCWGDRRAFELARKHIAPAVELLEIDIPDLTPERVGCFDIVLFAGVFYHLRHPFLMLERVGKLANEQLIVETHLDATDYGRPAMVFYPVAELGQDDTNWWGPNRACVEAMLRDIGFPRVEYTPHPAAPRGIFRALRA
jgi:tRNA (mo5U34)-methyltransferase